MFYMQFSAQPLPSQDANPVEEAKYETAPDHRQEALFHPPDFSNFQEAHKPKSNLELIRAYGIFTTCQIRPIVQHADTLLDYTKKVLGSTITYALVVQPSLVTSVQVWHLLLILPVSVFCLLKVHLCHGVSCPVVLFKVQIL